MRDTMDDPNADRLVVARERVHRALSLAGGQGWTVEVERTAEGYTLTIRKGSRAFRRKGIYEAVLEDEWSQARRALIDDARRDLEDG
jgi:hypothetical protein